MKPAPGAFLRVADRYDRPGLMYLKIAPDLRLKALPNPGIGGHGIPRAHDATYFNDRDYLYFGVAPVISLCAPWQVATDTYLADGAVTG